jgi:hypothetical protein
MLAKASASPRDVLRERHGVRDWLAHPTALLLGLGLAKLLAHLLTASRYGFHRDEFYYLASGQHLAWGFVDQPPVVPFLALVGSELFGATPWGLRVLSAVAGAATVVVAGLLARELGGGRFAQGMAALAVLFAPLFISANTMLQTVPFDQLWWLLGALGVARAVRTGSTTAWAFTGLVLGVALLTKYTVLLFGFGLLVGLVATPARAHLQTPGPWLAAGLSLGLFLPNLVWQIANEWPTLEFIANNNANVAMTVSDFLWAQPMMMGLPGAVLGLGGLAWFFTAAGRPYRVLGWIVLVTLGVLLLTGGKDYYLGPAYPLTFAAGAVGLEGWVRRRAKRWLAPALAAGFGVLSLAPIPVVLPILPVDEMVRLGLHKSHEPYAEMLGWPELVETVTAIYDGLPPEEQATTAIFTANYGEAGSVNLLGPARLPAAVSGHNAYHAWGPPPASTTTVIALGFSEEYLRRFFAEVEPVATTTNPYGVENEEYGQTVYLGRQPLVVLADVWADRYHYD